MKSNELNIYNKSIDDIYKEMDSSNNGLSSEEAEIRLEKNGFNKIKERKKTSVFVRVLNAFSGKVMFLLDFVVIFSVVVSYVRNESYIDSIIVAIIWIINFFLNYFEGKSVDNSIAKINDMFDSDFNVYRDGQIKSISADRIVLGDVIEVSKGDYIPCDARIISANDLEVNEASLTDNYTIVHKNSKVIDGNKVLSEQYNMLFAGSNIINGNAKIIAVATGMDTQLGKIANNLLSSKENVTPLENKVDQISNILMYISLVLITAMIVIGIINNNDLLDILMLSIILMIAAIPDSLSSIITIILSIGIKNMVKKNILIKNTYSVATLGSVNVICSGKTNNLTVNDMVIKSIYVNRNLYNDDSSFDKTDILNKCIYLCNDVSVVDDEYFGNDADVALYKYLDKINYRYKEKYELIERNPFDYERKMMEVKVKINNKKMSFIKGDFDVILGKSSRIIINDDVVELDSDKKEEIKNIVNYMSWESLEVLAFAYNDKDNNDDFIFIGLVGILDPIRKSTKEAIEMCKKADIKPILITGNSVNTALAIGRETNIIKSSDEIIDGSYLENVTDDELYDIVDKYSVYARISPNLKLKLIEIMQLKGLVVAMTGDGINDASAIKKSNVGIGLGVNSTEIVKEVADCILTDNSFLSIVNGIEEGRRVSLNIRKVIMYVVTTYLIEVLLIFIAMLFNIEMFTGIQIYWINLVTGTIPAIMLAFEKDENIIMDKNSDVHLTSFLSIKMVFNVVFKTFICFIVYLFFLKNTDLNSANTLLFILLIMHEFLFVYSCKNLNKSVLNKSFFSNKYLNISIILLILFQIIILMSSIGDYFVVKNISIFYIFIAFIVCVGLFIIDEVTKGFFVRKFGGYRNEK